MVLTMIGRLVVGAILVLATKGITAQALVVVQRDFSDLVSQAEFILEGTVGHITEAPDETGIQRTLVSLHDLILHKGQWEAPEFSLDIVGGNKNGFRSQVLELPTFVPGERVILFVRGNGREIFPVVGVHQGYFKVLANVEGRAAVVRCDGHSVVGRFARNLRFVPPSAFPPRQSISVEEFRQWIRDELQHTAKHYP